MRVIILSIITSFFCYAAISDKADSKESQFIITTNKSAHNEFQIIAIDYTTGQITINSLNVASIENIRGSSSTVIELTVQPNSNDIIPVRDQILEIDTANSNITVEADTFVGGSADAGVGYTTSSSYGN